MIFELTTLADLGEEEIKHLRPELLRIFGTPAGVLLAGDGEEHVLAWRGGFEANRPTWSDGMDRRVARIRTAERILAADGNAEYKAETYCRQQADLWRLAAEISAINAEIDKRKAKALEGMEGVG